VALSGEARLSGDEQSNDDLIDFRAHAIAFWAESRSGTAERANAHTETADTIVQQWTDAGKAREILTPMLQDDLIEIRFAAASYLLKGGDTGAAIPVLEDLAQTKTSVGMLASSARFLLMKHRSEHTS
jgi:hypothetical protein